MKSTFIEEYNGLCLHAISQSLNTSDITFLIARSSYLSIHGEQVIL